MHQPFLQGGVENHAAGQGIRATHHGTAALQVALDDRSGDHEDVIDEYAAHQRERLRGRAATGDCDAESDHSCARAIHECRATSRLDSKHRDKRTGLVGRKH